MGDEELLGSETVMDDESGLSSSEWGSSGAASLERAN